MAAALETFMLAALFAIPVNAADPVSDYGKSLAVDLETGGTSARSARIQLGEAGLQRARSTQPENEPDRASERSRITERLLGKARIQELAGAATDGKAPTKGSGQSPSTSTYTRPEVVIDGSNVPKEVQFEKKKYEYMWNPNDGASYGNEAGAKKR